jgi:hypothetical protein
VLTRYAISVSISEKGRPIKSTLQKFCSGLLCTKVAFASMIMTKGDDIGLVMLIFTSPSDLVRIILEHLRIIPEKVFTMD